MKEPLEFFSQNYPFDLQLTDHFVTGDLFTAVVLKNGNMGVCANPDGRITIDLYSKSFPNLDNYHDRIAYHAYLNALLNPDAPTDIHSELTELADFGRYKKVVMIGYFSNIAQKLSSNGINMVIFDKNERNVPLADLAQLNSHLAEADAVILTSSSIANNSFSDIISQTPEFCNIYLLGPSSLLHSDMFLYRNIKMIFGAKFQRYQKKIIDIIAAGGCGRDFLPFASKVSASAVGNLT